MDSRSILSDTLFSGVRQLFSISRGLVAIPLITKILGAGSYGTWTTLIAFVGLASSVGGLHLHGSLTRYGTRDGESVQTYSDTLSIAFCSGLVLFTLGIFIIKTFDPSNYFDVVTADSRNILIIVSGLIFSNIILDVNRNFPRSKSKVKTFLLISICKDVLEIIALIFVLLSGGGILEGVLAFLFISLGLNLFIMAFVFYHYSVPLPNLKSYVKYLRYGIPMVPTSLSNKLLSDADKYLLLIYMGPTAVGIYSVVYSVTAIIQRLSGLLGPTLYPNIARAWDNSEQSEVIGLYNRIYVIYTIIVIPSFVGLVLISGQLLRLLSTGTIARSGVGLVPIVGLAFVVRGYGSPLVYTITASEETQKLSIASILAAFLNIILNLVLIPPFNLVGAAFSTLFSLFLLSVLIFYFSPIGLYEVVPFKIVFISLFSSLVMAIILDLSDISKAPIVDMIKFVLFGCMIYFILFVTLYFACDYCFDIRSA